VLGEASTGAASDLAGATDLATKMVRDWGLSPRLGPLGFANSTPSSFSPDGFTRAPYAEATQQVIDEEVARLLRAAEQRATELLRTHRERFDRVVEALLEHETIDGSDLLTLLGVDAEDGRDARTAPAAVPAADGRDGNLPAA
jgi:cell division protease FtsH